MYEETEIRLTGFFTPLVIDPSPRKDFAVDNGCRFFFGDGLNENLAKHRKGFLCIEKGSNGMRRVLHYSYNLHT